MRCFLLLVVFVLALVGIGREVLVAAKARRSMLPDEKAIFRRFRRRVKGIAIAVAAATLAAYFDEVAAAAGLDIRQRFWLLGIVTIAIFWMLILAGRDLRETVETAAVERQAITMQALESVEREIRRKQEARRAARDAAGGKPSPGSANDPGNG